MLCYRAALPAGGKDCSLTMASSVCPEAGRASNFSKVCAVRPTALRAGSQISQALACGEGASYAKMQRISLSRGSAHRCHVDERACNTLHDASPKQGTQDVQRLITCK